MRLVYSSDVEPGYHRQRRWGRFVYLDSNGRYLRSQTALARLRALGVPPAYTHVWYCMHANGHIQATARDSRGRKQYFYHPTWTARQSTAKFDHLFEVGRMLPRLRRRVQQDLQRHSTPKERVISGIVRLLDTTYLRVGNEVYAKENQSYGLTTLRKRHLRTDGTFPNLSFTGKSGVQHTVPIHDPRIISLLHVCHELPGQFLFSFTDDTGTPHHIHSHDVNAYLSAASDSILTAKDFRTWHASARVAFFLSQHPESTILARKKQVTAAIRAAASALGNTPSVCRASYIAPFILERYLAGKYPRPQQPAPRAHLHQDELFFLQLLHRKPPLYH